MTAIVVILSGCSGRDHRDLDGCRWDRGRSDRIPQGPKRSGGRLGDGFLLRDAKRARARRKKTATGPLREDD